MKMIGVLVTVLVVFLPSISAELQQERTMCEIPSLADVFLPHSKCFAEDEMELSSRTLEVWSQSLLCSQLNEATLDKALSSLWRNEDASVMALFYASWCPFSKQLQPMFESLSSEYPMVYHISIEESSVRPSVLSKYGVNSFPALIFLTKNSQTRYHGSRTLKELTNFYKNMTGYSPGYRAHQMRNDVMDFSVHLKKSHKNQEACPYPKAISPEKWLQDDTYLTLATVFLILRVTVFLFPLAIENAKWWWHKWHILK